MLTDLHVENFRVFDQEVHLRLRPITVLIGRNSAGKSSILKFLLMLQQSLGANEGEFLAPEGDRVHLGAFADLRNSVRKRRKLRFQLRFRTTDLPSRPERAMLDAVKSQTPTTDPITNKTELRITVEDLRNQTMIEREEADYTIDTTVSYSAKIGQKGSHSVKARMGDDVLFHQFTENLQTAQFLQFPIQANDPVKSLKGFWTDRFLMPVRREISSWRHLSPIREESQRAIVTSSPPQDSVGQMGEYAMPHLQRIYNAKGTEADFVFRHMSEVAGVSSIRFESSMKGYLAHAQGTNRLTNAESYLSDFGFGVSQCLPIFVQGVLMRENQLLMVEQPEAQLHPTAQLEMGSFFAELWSERKVMSLIETHSSQIVLRLRRLVANGSLSPNDVSLAYIHVSDDGMPAIKNLDINDAGNLEKGLPMEFFGADITEGLHLRAKK